MELLEPQFKLPEVAFGAGVSASNLTNWYDRDLVTIYCQSKEGWKRFSAMDVYHVALIKQLVVLGVPIPHAEYISKHYLDHRLIPCRLVPVSPLLFVFLQSDEMLFVEPAGDEFKMLAYDRADGDPNNPGEFPSAKSDRGHIIVPIGPVFHSALSRALTGRTDVLLEYKPAEGERYVKDVKEFGEMRDRHESAKDETSSVPSKPKRRL